MPTAAQYRAQAQAVARREFGDSPLAAIWLRMLEQESGGFDPNVVEGRRVSSAGAQGVGQFMPATAKGLGINPLDPSQALPASARYLKQQIAYFGGDTSKGVAAYNAGAGTIEKAVKAGGARWQQYIPGETQAYLRITRPWETAAPGTTPVAPKLPAQGPITQGFGPTSEPLDSGYAGYAHFNKGIDIGVPVGTPVHAMTPGKVIAAGEGTEGWGVRVWVEAPDGTVHNYGHLSEARVKVGDTVQSGQAIALSGNTGKSTGPHLSYDIWRPGKQGNEYLDPEQYHASAAAQDTSGAVRQQGGQPVTTPTPRRSEQDEAFGRALDTAGKAARAADARVASIQSRIDTETDPTTKAFLKTDLDSALVAQKAANDQWIRLLSFDKPEPGAQQASEAAITNARADLLAAQTGIYTATLNGLNAAFGQDKEIRTLLFNVLDANVKNQAAYYNALLNKGQIDIQSYASLLTADTAKQAAYVSQAVASKELATFIGDQRKWNAINLINDGFVQHAGTLPGLPDLNTARQKLGLPAMQIPVNRVDPASFDPLRMLAEGRQASGIPDPSKTFDPDIASMRAAVQTGQQLQIPAPQPITFGDVNDPTKGVISLPAGNIPASMLGANGEIPPWLADLINPYQEQPPVPPGDETAVRQPVTVQGPVSIAGVGQLPTTLSSRTPRLPGTVAVPGSIAGFEALDQAEQARARQTSVPGSAGVPGQSSPSFVGGPVPRSAVPLGLSGGATQRPTTALPATATRPVNPAGEIEVDPVTGRRRRRIAGGFWVPA